MKDKKLRKLLDDEGIIYDDPCTGEIGKYHYGIGYRFELVEKQNQYINMKIDAILDHLGCNGDIVSQPNEKYVITKKKKK